MTCFVAAIWPNQIAGAIARVKVWVGGAAALFYFKLNPWDYG